MKLYRFLLFAIFLGLPIITYAQMEGSVYSVTGRGGVGTTFVTDYQAIGINPANLGIKKNYRDPKFTFGLLESNFIFSSEAINTQELLSALTDYRTTKFSLEDKQRAVDKFDSKVTTVDASVMLFGASMQLPKKWGGVAISIRDNVHTRVKTNAFAAEVLFFGATSSYFPKLELADGSIIDNPRHTGQGEPLTSEQISQVRGGYFENVDDAQTYSELLAGTKTKSTWVREYNAAWGAQILETYDLSIYGGFGAKYIQGLMILDFEVDDNGNMKDAVFSSSFVNPEDVLNAASPDANAIINSTTADNRSMTQKALFPKNAGWGWGLDFGLTFVIKRNLKVSAAISNFGKMNWEGQVYSINDGKLANINGQGLDNYNFLINDQSAFQFAGTNSALDWTTDAKKESFDLPTILRFGASYEFFRLVHVGFDVIIPQNNEPGNIENPFYAIGGDFRPFKRFAFSTGFNYGGNNEVFNFPLGVTYFSRKGNYEAGISTHDVKSYFAQSANTSTISLAGGFLRFKI